VLEELASGEPDAEKIVAATKSLADARKPPELIGRAGVSRGFRREPYSHGPPHSGVAAGRRLTYREPTEG
jgi:hypothetical protein